VQDNWVCKTMRAGIQAAGEGLTIRRNVISDTPGKVAWVDPTGTRQPDSSTSFDNWAIDWSGHNVAIEGNNYVVYRHQIMDSPNVSADGEGIVARPCCGGTSVDGVVIRKNTGQGAIGINRVPDVQRVLIEANQIASLTPNQPAVYINADTRGEANAMDRVAVKDNQLTGGILTQAGVGGSDMLVQNNNGSGVITYSCAVDVQDNRGFVEAPCLATQPS